MKVNGQARIIVVNDQAETLSPFIYLLEHDRQISGAYKFEFEYSAKMATLNYNPHDFHFAVIDASDDFFIQRKGSVEREFTLSEFWKSQNPNLIVVGTSIQDEKFAEVGGFYDEKIRIEQFDEQIIDLLRKYKFISDE